eukprot:806957-Pelagomonas_calceolata.AAC.1
MAKSVRQLRLSRLARGEGARIKQEQHMSIAHTYSKLKQLPSHPSRPAQRGAHPLEHRNRRPQARAAAGVQLCPAP